MVLPEAIDIQANLLGEFDLLEHLTETFPMAYHFTGGVGDGLGEAGDS